MAAPVDKRVDVLEGQSRTMEKSISTLQKSIEALTRSVDAVRNETAKQLSTLEPQFSTLNKGLSALADRVTGLEKHKPPSDTSLETFKKAFNSFAKELAAAQSQQASDAKALNNAIAALDKRVQDAEKKVVKVIETQGGGV